MKNQIGVRIPAVERMNTVMSRVEELSTKTDLTAQEKREREGLLAEQSVLKEGLTREELRAATIERLEKIAGVSLRDCKIPDRADREWRLAAKNELPAEKRYYQDKHGEFRAAQLAGQQTISYTVGAAGGFFIPTGWADRNLQSRRLISQIISYAQEISTEDGKPLALPSWDDVAVQSQLIGENTKYEAPTINTNTTQLNAYTGRSGVLYVSTEALDDAGVPWPSLIERAFINRHARFTGNMLINGTGVNQPTGILAALNALDLPEIIAGGANINTGNASDTGANSISSFDLLDLFFSVNAEYRQRPSCAWVMHDNTLQTIVSKVDKVGNPLVRFTESPSGLLIPRIFGAPVAISNDMPQIQNNAPTVCFGDWSQFVWRHVRSGEVVQALPELAAEFGVTGFQAYTRIDSNLSCPNTAYPPIQQLIQHS